MIKEDYKAHQRNARQPFLFEPDDLAFVPSGNKKRVQKDHLHPDYTPPLHQQSFQHLRKSFEKKLKIKPIDKIAQVREPRLSIGEINISIFEIIDTFGFENFNQKGKINTAFSYLLILQSLVNDGKVANTPDALCTALLSIEHVTISTQSNISPQELNRENTEELIAPVSLAVQRLLIDSLFEGPFKNFEPTKTFPTVTFSELYDLYAVWLALLSNFSFDPSPLTQTNTHQMETERGIILHEFDMYLDALRASNSDPFPTNSELSIEFSEILAESQLSFIPLEEDYFRFCEIVYQRMLQRGKTLGNQYPDLYNIWDDDLEEINRCIYVLAQHWIHNIFPEPLFNTSIYREVLTTIRLGGVRQSSTPLGINIITCFDKIYSRVPTGIALFRGELPYYLMSDLKFRTFPKQIKDPFKIEIEKRTNGMLRYLAQALLGSNHVTGRKLIGTPLTKKGKKTPYTLHAIFPSVLDESLYAELSIFNPHTAQINPQTIEMTLDEQEWLNVWLTQVFIPFIHLFDSIDRDINRLYKMVS